ERVQVGRARYHAPPGVAHPARQLRPGDGQDDRTGRASPDPMHLYELYGASGDGNAAAVVGGFQRLAATPDGSGVVFEVTNGVAVLPGISLDPIEEGFFFVRTDGTGLRRLGPPSRASLFQLFPDPAFPLGFGVNVLKLNIAFSRDGRTVVYTDLGPGPSGEEAVQVVTLDLATARRTQLTTLATPEEGQVRCHALRQQRHHGVRNRRRPGGSRALLHGQDR